MELIKIKDVLKLNHRDEINYNDIVFVEKYYDQYHINIKNCRGYNTSDIEELKYYIEKINNTFKEILKLNKDLDKYNKAKRINMHNSTYVKYNEWLNSYEIDFNGNIITIQNKHGLNVQLFELLH
jgi:hypothetical protein